MDKVRIGIAGVGGMGSFHASYLLEGQIKDVELTAVCDIDPAKLTRFANLKTFTSSAEMIRSGEIDLILVATPHYDHTTIGIDALEQGLHVIVEKPISVHKADAEKLIAAHTNPKQIFAAMFNQRTDGKYIKAREVIKNGELGKITRVNWIITNWFRTEAYYASGGWRATWAGEGGGVLMNQCPHNLDLLQWIVGMMPNKMRAFCQFGQWHNIEVEDQVTAYFEYENGATGVFITTTGEAPGTNRLEIVGERGKLVIDNDLKFSRTESSVSEFCKTSTEGFASPGIWEINIPFKSGPAGQHQVITQNVVNAILKDETLMSPAEEGIRGLELCNAMLLSTFTDSTVSLPIDPVVYEKELKQRIATSTFKKEVKEIGPANMTDSFR
ncbi:MAG: Gfo/Idh/MocA family oxidoreductase [bacterium]